MVPLVTTDKRLLRLVGIMQSSGVMINGVVNPGKEGAMQGGPSSPLLSNIVLDELDQELEKRGLEFCRFADDCTSSSSRKKRQRG
jgi:RNA-directed DNA polymerase